MLGRMDTAELAAREAIRDTLARYCHLVDAGRIDELLELFADDAVLEAGDLPPAHGRAAIREVFLGTGRRLVAATGKPLIRHHLSNVAIEMEGPEAAAAVSYFLALTERGVDHWGRYRDRLVRRGTRWVLQHRRVRTDGRAPTSVLETR